MENKLKLEISQLKNYLGTGLKFKLCQDLHEEMYDLEDSDKFQESFTEGAIWTLEGWTDIDIPAGEGELSGSILSCNNFYTSAYIGFKPLMYRLQDLDKFIAELGFMPIEEIDNHHNFSVLRKSDIMTDPTRYPFTVLQALFQWHFWPFGDEYFEQGLIIDKLAHGK